MISVKKLSFQYKSGKGIFDLDFNVNEGEVMGYLGPNGAGKTTTIRLLMGFMRQSAGSCTISGLDCFDQAPQIKKLLGYIPGEIAFPDGMAADEFLRFMGDMRQSKDKTRQKQLIDMFEFVPKGPIKKFSKGMKQKLGIVAAFMHDPQVIILDEPTSGLDPLMQNRFVDLVLEEKKRGKTILMSSHMFEEIERTCDNVLIIKEGRIAAKSDIETLKSSQRKAFLLKSADNNEAKSLLTQAGFETNINESGVEVFITGESVDKFIKTIAKLTLTGFDAKAQTLEDVFMHFYGKEGK